MLRCEEALREKGGDFGALAGERLEQILPSRMNRSRIDRCIHESNPDRERLIDLADGMEVDLPEGFTPKRGGAR